jgi:hypothetical protein
MSLTQSSYKEEADRRPFVGHCMSLSLIENASDRDLRSAPNTLPEAFPIKASDNSGVIALCLESECRVRPLLRIAGLSGDGLKVIDSFADHAGFTSFRWARGGR